MVFIEMTVTNENDEAYANAVFIDNSEEIVEDWIKKAERFRAKKLKSGTAVPLLSFFALKRSAFLIQSSTISSELSMKTALAYASSFSFVTVISINTTIDKIRQN